MGTQQQPVMRRKGDQHGRVGRDLDGAEHGDGAEPNGHDRTEQAADGAGAAHLHREQAEDDNDGDGQHEALQPRRDDLQPFNGGQYGDGGGDGAVAKEQAGPADADQAQQAPHPRAGAPALRNRHEGQDAALAVVVGAHHQEDVFHRDGEHQRPEDQGKHTEDLDAAHARVGEVLQAGLQGVERRSADVAVDDAEHAQDGGGTKRAAAVRQVPVVNAGFGDAGLQGSHTTARLWRRLG